VELLTRLQSRALAAGKRVFLDILARKIIASRSCNLEWDTTIRQGRLKGSDKEQWVARRP
jgi:hypothetical protein